MSSLNRDESFQVGFWIGIRGLQQQRPDSFGFIETNAGSIPPRHISDFTRGFKMGKDIRDVLGLI